MPTEFEAICQRDREDGEYRTILFNGGDGRLPAVMMTVLKEFELFEAGARYRFTIERSPE